MKKDTLFQYRCYNDHPSIKDQGERLFQEFQEGRRRKVRDKNEQSQFRKAFKTALAGLYFGKAFDQHGSIVRIPLDRNHYTGATRISPVFRPELLQVLNWLIKQGYLRLDAPASFIEGRWRPAGYRLTAKWLSLASVSEHDPEEIQARTCRNKGVAFVELRDGRKSIRLKASPQKDFSVRLLGDYETEAHRHRYSIGARKLPPYLFSLTRIYSKGSYSSGGRFYSLWQSYRSQLRLHLRIDGEPVCEVDYCFLHPALLYLEKGLHLEHDPYEVAGFPRSIAKVGFQILLNSKRPFPPISSLAYFLNKKKSGKGGRKDPDWQAFTFDADCCRRLAEALAERNSEIADSFCKGKGLELQHTDSILASAVLQAFVRQHPGTMVIPVHDSFIVKQRDLPILLAALEHAERSLAALKHTPLRQPALKVTVLAGSEIDGYEKQLEPDGVEVIQGSVIKAEKVVQEAEEYFPDNEIEEDSILFDSGFEE